MILIKKILVATDFGEASDAALEYGRDLGRTYEATLHVLHVTENVYARYADDGSIAFLPEMQNDIEHALKLYEKCKREDVWPAYGDAISVLDLPPWAQKRQTTEEF